MIQFSLKPKSLPTKQFSIILTSTLLITIFINLLLISYQKLQPKEVAQIETPQIVQPTPSPATPSNQVKIIQSYKFQHTDPYTLNSAQIFKNVLTIGVSYNGGCKEHDFDLIWDKGFQKSKPIQINLFLAHEAHLDPCEVVLTDNFIFDLTPIKDEYLKSFEGEEITIILHDSANNKHILTYSLTDPTADWKIYRNKDMGFEIKYPSGWTEYKTEEGPEEEKRISFVTNPPPIDINTTMISITTFDNHSRFSLEQWLDNVFLAGVSDVIKDNLSKETILIAGGESLAITGLPSRWGTFDVLTLSGENVYRISLSPYDAENTDKSTFNQILSTFQFIPEVCKPCPQFMPPADGWCSDGEIILPTADECGCQGPPECKRNGN